MFACEPRFPKDRGPHCCFHSIKANLWGFPRILGRISRLRSHRRCITVLLTQRRGEPAMKCLLLVLCVLPGVAFAGNVYRCVSHAGHVSYQSSTCPARHRTDQVIEFSHDPVVEVAAAGVKARHPKTAIRRSGLNQRQVKARKAPPSACAKARASRDSQLARLGLKRTFDDLRRIDDAVRGVCRG